MAKENFFQLIKSKISLDPNQEKILEKVYQFLTTKNISQKELEDKLTQFGFAKNIVAFLVEVLKKEFPSNIVASENGDQKELLNKYYKKIVHSFLNDLLFLYEVETEVRLKTVALARFSFFFEQIPFLIELDSSKDLQFLVRPQVLEHLKKSVNSLIVNPLKRVFIEPGYLAVEEFVKITHLKGLDFLELTGNLEKEEFVNFNFEKKEVRFIINKIKVNPEEFSRSLDMVTQNFAEGPVIKNRIMMAYDKSIRIGREDLTHAIYNKIQTNDVLLRFHYLKYTDVIPNVTDLRELFRESFLLLNFFKSKTKPHQNLNKDDFIAYSENLCALIFKLCDKELNGLHWTYIYKSLACLSNLPGKGLKEINAFFKNRNSIQYDSIKIEFEKHYK